MRFQILASGSKGNMTHIEAGNTHLILDAGLALSEIERRGSIDYHSIDGILLTHSHGDHTSALLRLIKKTKATLYTNKIVVEELIQKKFRLDGIKIQYLENNKKYKIKDISFFTLELSHDVGNCNGFIFASGKETLAYVTDTGLVPLIYMDLLSRVDTLIIEANHDIEMLNESNRPWPLKQRILSFRGHLSNITCGEVVNKLLEKKKIKNIILAHLSEECNDECLAIDTVMSLIEGDYLPKFYIARQRESLPMMEVKGDSDNEN